MSSLLNLVPLTPNQSLFTLVENRTKFELEEAQLNIFETHHTAHKVSLQFSDLVITGMLRGKKVMHLKRKKNFDYVPGQSVIVPPGEEMIIDFPEANESNPTQCLALAISKDKIGKLLERLNHYFPKDGSCGEWEILPQYFHLKNNPFLAEAINQLVAISINDQSKAKGSIANLRIEEIMIRLMQTQVRAMIEAEYKQLTNNPFAEVVSYIKNNLDSNISIETLCKKAFMSKAKFYRCFNAEMGVSPAKFIQVERLKKAKKLLRETSLSVTEVGYAVGFNNIAHFITFFNKAIGQTPKAYQLSN